MNPQQLTEMITKQVMSRLSTENSASYSSSCDGSSSCGCQPGWDGVGTIDALLKEGIDRLGVGPVPSLGSCPDPQLARMIDHTLLKGEATEKEILELCQQAREYCFKSVCVNPYWVETAAKALRGSAVKVCTVVGFPLGATNRRVKELETRIAIDSGAGEIDTVINIGALKSGDDKTVLEDLKAVVRACRTTTISKVILETCYLTDAEIVRGCELARQAGLDYVKTSTGFGPKGATVEHIRLMRKTVGDAMGVKASGGIRDHETALNMIAAGASRLGVSASVAIVECKDTKKGGY